MPERLQDAMTQIPMSLGWASELFLEVFESAKFLQWGKRDGDL